MLGCQIWNKDENTIHWLYPSKWFKLIPEGLEIITISNKIEKFDIHDTDNDMRFGALAFGFIQEKQK